MTNWNDILKNRKEVKALLLELLEGLEEDISDEDRDIVDNFVDIEMDEESK